MREAIKEARKAEASSEVPVGALLVYQEKIIARAHNQVELLQDASAHAEMLAITMGSNYLHNFRLSEMTLYTTLEPCPMCAGAILLARLKRVVFGASDFRMGAAGSLCDLFHQASKIHSLEVRGGVLASECGLLLKQFFQKRREENESEAALWIESSS